MQNVEHDALFASESITDVWDLVVVFHAGEPRHHRAGRIPHTSSVGVHSRERFRGTFMSKALPVRFARALALTLITFTATAQLAAEAQQLEANITPVTDAMLT